MEHSPDPGPIPFDETVLTEIGRVTVAATNLEFLLAQFSAEVQPELSADQLVSRPGQALKGAREAAELLEPELAEQFKSWVNEAAGLLEERHKIVHAVWMIRAAAPGVGEYFGHHARTKTELDASASELGEMATKLNPCASHGFELFLANAPKLKPRPRA